MTTVRVKASREYDVFIGRGLTLAEDGGAGRPGRRIALVSDSNVMELYGGAAKAKLEAAGYKVTPYVFPAGEASKNMGELARLLEFLAEEHFTRTDRIAALGGGVTGDLAGFAAATYLRGIEFIQIPTTVLAAVDSSVGGKTAVDLKAGKNLAGAFWQPSAVFCDIDAFSTLSPEIFADGMAEAIKYGVIRDRGLFERFEKGIAPEEYEDIIARCVSIKRDIVEEDERDTGVRQLLNFGHTFAHGIEKCSGFRVTHGHAVAIGMVLASRLAENSGFAKEPVSMRLRGALEAFGLPTSTDIPLAELIGAAASDKKRSGDTITLILPENIGCCRRADFGIAELSGIEELLK